MEHAHISSIMQSPNANYAYLIYLSLFLSCKDCLWSILGVKELGHPVDHLLGGGEMVCLLSMLAYLLVTICVPSCLCVSLDVIRNYSPYPQLLVYDHFNSTLSGFYFSILQDSSIAFRIFFHPAFVLFVVWDHTEYHEVFHCSYSRLSLPLLLSVNPYLSIFHLSLTFLFITVAHTTKFASFTSVMVPFLVVYFICFIYGIPIFSYNETDNLVYLIPLFGLIVVSVFLRIHFMRTYAIPSSGFLTECCTVFWCMPCSTAQSKYTVHYRL